MRKGALSLQKNGSNHGQNLALTVWGGLPISEDGHEEREGVSASALKEGPRCCPHLPRDTGYESCEPHRLRAPHLPRDTGSRFADTHDELKTGHVTS